MYMCVFDFKKCNHSIDFIFRPHFETLFLCWYAVKILSYFNFESGVNLQCCRSQELFWILLCLLQGSLICKPPTFKVVTYATKPLAS